MTRVPPPRSASDLDARRRYIATLITLFVVTMTATAGLVVIFGR